MRLLWTNPAFLDYRVPAYTELNKLSNNNFYILFDKNRVPERIPVKIKKAIGDHALIFDGKKIIINNRIFPITPGLYKKIKRVNPDVIISEGFFQWTPKALCYSLLHRKPLVIAYERTCWTERNCSNWIKIYRKFVNLFVSGYLCNGTQTMEYLRSLGIKDKKLYLGGMSADSTNMQMSVSRLSANDIAMIKKKLSLSNNGLIYTYIGRLIPLKGIHHLLEAWRKHIIQHKQDELLIVGGGELYDSFITKYGNDNSIHFTGSIDYDDIYQYYAVSDVFIIPTLQDNWSLVVPEAMSVGLPVAVSIYNGCHPELCKEGENGYKFDPLQEDSIISVLDKFHHIDLKKYGENSIKIEEQYNYKHVAENMFNACEIIYSNLDK